MRDNRANPHWEHCIVRFQQALDEYSHLVTIIGNQNLERLTGKPWTTSILEPQLKLSEKAHYKL